jgi:hypothetical protein
MAKRKPSREYQHFIDKAHMDAAALGYAWEWSNPEDKMDPGNSRVTVRRLDAYDGPNLFPVEPYYGLRFAQLTQWIGWQQSDKGKGCMYDFGAILDFLLADTRKRDAA